MNPESRFQVLHNQNAKRGGGPAFLSVEATAPVRRLHASVPSYAETPLASLKHMASRLGLRGLYVKDESRRFGLNAFKGLGGIYALSRIACEALGLPDETPFPELQRPKNRERLGKLVFVTATDGNHGKGVAWASTLLGCESHVYMPRGSSERRAQAIRDAGAVEVKITDMGYDDTVRYAREMAERNDWTLVQDTAWPGYESVPTWIVQGYTTMAYEALKGMERLGERPTHVFLQAGVGAMAGGVAGFLAGYYGASRPEIVVVEPEDAACIFESARRADGAPHAALGGGHTIMAGLNCGEPCTLTWPVLRDYADGYISCPDYVAARGMRLLAAPCGDDPKVVSGESGAATMGALSLLMECPVLAKERDLVGLTGDSVVLLISTEGDTDPISYRHIVYDGAYPTPLELFR